MAAFFESPKPLVRAAALMSLNVKKPLPVEIRQSVLARLDDPSAEVRQAAVMAAGVLNLTKAIPHLIRTAASQGDADLRSQAITAFCQMPDSRALAIYRQAAGDPDPSLRRRGPIRPLRTSPARSIRKSLEPAPPAASRSLPGPAPVRPQPAGRSTSRRGAVLREPVDWLRTLPRAAGRGSGTSGPDLTGLASRRDKAAIIGLLLAPPAGRRRPSTRQEPGRRMTPLEFTDLIGFLDKLKQPSGKKPTASTSNPCPTCRNPPRPDRPREPARPRRRDRSGQDVTLSALAPHLRPVHHEGNLIENEAGVVQCGSGSLSFRRFLWTPEKSPP